MSTLTLAVEEFFRPESSVMPTLATGPQTHDNISAAKYKILAPELRQSKFSLGSFSNSTPELVSHESAAYEDTRAQDDSVSAVSWARTGLATRLATKSGTGLGTGAGFNNAPDPKSFVFPKPTVSPFVDLPKAVNNIAKLPDATNCTEVVNSSLSLRSQRPPVKQRSVSEEVTAPPLRKLKSSLKLPKLTKSHSMSHLSPKSVRFASRLEKVKMFDGKESPSALSMQNTPSGSPKYDFPIDDYFSIRHGFNDIFDDQDCPNSDSESDTFTEFTKDKQYKITSRNFVSPQNIYDKRNSPVYLQSVYLTPDKKSLELLVMCQNLAFEKSLSVKFTFNDWQSSMIFNSATYTKSFASVNFDQFKFTIPLTHLPSSLSTQFCIKYVVNDVTFWDNNDSKNYTFLLDKYFKPLVSKDSFSFKPSANMDSFTYRPPKFPPKSVFETGERSSTSLDAESLVNSGPRTTSEVPHYNDLVTKLLSVKDTEERPKFTRSLSSSPKPRYSQSYMSKMGSDTSGQMSPLGKKVSTSTLKGEVAFKAPYDTTFKNIHTEKPLSEECRVPENSTRPQLSHSFVSAPATLSNMSYADLLQNYCFNGADNSIQASCGNTIGSFNSSCNSSSASLSSDYMTPSSTFQSVNDSFYV